MDQPGRPVMFPMPRLARQPSAWPRSPPATGPSPRSTRSTASEQSSWPLNWALELGVEQPDLVLASEATAWGVLGPRITPQTVSRLRRLACPTSAAALLIALATDARAGRLTLCAPRRISPDLGQVGLLTGTYRIPAARCAAAARGAARPPGPRAARLRPVRSPRRWLATHPARGDLIARAATLAGVLAPLAATPAGRSDSGPEGPVERRTTDTTVGQVACRVLSMPSRIRSSPISNSSL